MPNLAENAMLLTLAITAIALWFAMPQRADWFRVLGAFGAAVGLLTFVKLVGDPGGEIVAQTLFWIFAAGAILCGILMITSRDPVQAALWFAVATLSVCGLFLQLSAAFLAAATVIVYAGAIIVTFMFVIMLAQQDGATAYDARARFPLAAVCASFFLLGALAMNLEPWTSARSGKTSSTVAAVASDAHPLSKIETDDSRGELHALGRSLFGDHLFAVELAGTLLLIATIGAIMLAPRRAQGTL